MRRFSFLPTLLLSTALVFSLAACDSNEDDDHGGGPGQLGSYAGTLGGDLSGEISGTAFFSVVEDPEIPGGRAFVLWLMEGALSETTSAGEYIYFLRYGDRPGTGSHPIGQDPEEGGDIVAGYFDVQAQNSTVMLNAETGTFTVTGSSSSTLEGTFSFSGSGFDATDSENPTEITGSVQGSFDAVYIDPGNGPDLPIGDL